MADVIRNRFTKKDDKVTVGRQTIINAIKNLPDGDWIQQIEKYSPKKTYAQIKFFHGPVVEVYMDYTGYSYDDAKYTLKKYYGVNKLVKDAKTGKQEPEIRSLADYTKEEMQAFFDRLLNHFEYDCGMVIDSETRKQFKVNLETGEMEEI